MNKAYMMYLALLGTHFVADFVLQTHWQASNKSKNNIALTQHVLVYTGCIGLMASGFMLGWLWVPFAIGNGVLHWVTDYFTSRMSSKHFNKDWHKFFVIIGMDQLIHQLTLAITLWMVL